MSHRIPSFDPVRDLSTGSPITAVEPRSEKLKSLFLSALILAAGTLPQAAQAQPMATCNAQLSMRYTQVDDANRLGSIDTVELSFGAQEIAGGSELTVSEIHFDLDCQANHCENNPAKHCGETVPDCGGADCIHYLPGDCVDDGSVAGFVVDSITVDPLCDLSTDITTTHPGGGAPNEVVFTLDPALVIPQYAENYCAFTFQIRKLSPTSNDSTPLQIEQRARFVSATCDNGLDTDNIVTGELDVHPYQTETSAPTLGPAGGAALGIALLAFGIGMASRKSSPRRD